MIVNHKEQITVYERIASKLGLTEKYGEVVYRPTRFINTYSPENPMDVAFIDEAHLLWTRGVNGLYIFACDKELREALRRAAR